MPDEKRILDERYELFERVGEGGMGAVYRAYNHRLQRPVAVKLIGLHAAPSGAQIQRMQREARALARLDHPNILKVLDFGAHNPTQPYLITEFIDGVPLNKLIGHQTLAIDRSLDLAQQVCSGMAHAHKQGILHRDLKPSNILIVNEAEGEP